MGMAWACDEGVGCVIDDGDMACDGCHGHWSGLGAGSVNFIFLS